MKSSTSFLLACLGSIASLFGCQSVSPATPQEVQGLENCATPEDDAKVQAAERAIRQGEHKAQLPILRELFKRNGACAKIAILTSIAVERFPLAQRKSLSEELRAGFVERLRGAEDKALRANLGFAASLFARDGYEARRLLEQAVRDNPKHYFAFVKLGEELLRRGDLEAARERLSRAVALRKDLAEGWLLLARVAEERGLYRTADKHYQAYLGLRPLDRTAQLNYARLLVHNLRDADRAEPLLDKLYEQDPGDVELALHRGLAFYLQRRYPKAEATYREALERAPREPRIVLSLGNLYFGDYARPRAALQAYRYLSKLPSSEDPLTMLHQGVFVGHRIRKLEASLRKGGKSLPKAPKTIADIFAESKAKSAKGRP